MKKIILFFKTRVYPFLVKFYSCLGIEIKESKELIFLIRKSFSNQLGADEQKKVTNQILDICKIIPLLLIFIIPCGGLILALIFRFLPKKIFYPSAFLDLK